MKEENRELVHRNKQCACWSAGSTVGDFQTIARLKNVGIDVYRYVKKDIQGAKENETGDSYIIDCATNIQLSKYEFSKQLGMDIVSCPKCQGTVERAQCFLKNVAINNNMKTIGLCACCLERSNMSCKCNEVVKLFHEWKSKSSKCHSGNQGLIYNNVTLTKAQSENILYKYTKSSQLLTENPAIDIILNMNRKGRKGRTLQVESLIDISKVSIPSKITLLKHTSSGGTSDESENEDFENAWSSVLFERSCHQISVEQKREEEFKERPGKESTKYNFEDKDKLKRNLKDNKADTDTDLLQKHETPQIVKQIPLEMHRSTEMLEDTFLFPCYAKDVSKNIRKEELIKNWKEENLRAAQIRKEEQKIRQKEENFDILLNQSEIAKKKFQGFRENEFKEKEHEEYKSLEKQRLEKVLQENKDVEKLKELERKIEESKQRKQEQKHLKKICSPVKTREMQMSKKLRKKDEPINKNKDEDQVTTFHKHISKKEELKSKRKEERLFKLLSTKFEKKPEINLEDQHISVIEQTKKRQENVKKIKENSPPASFKDISAKRLIKSQKKEKHSRTEKVEEPEMVQEKPKSKMEERLRRRKEDKLRSLMDQRFSMENIVKGEQIKISAEELNKNVEIDKPIEVFKEMDLTLFTKTSMKKNDTKNGKPLKKDKEDISKSKKEERMRRRKEEKLITLMDQRYSIENIVKGEQDKISAEELNKNVEIDKPIEVFKEMDLTLLKKTSMKKNDTINGKPLKKDKEDISESKKEERMRRQKEEKLIALMDQRYSIENVVKGEQDNVTTEEIKKNVEMNKPIEVFKKVNLTLTKEKSMKKNNMNKETPLEKEKEDISESKIEDRRRKRKEEKLIALISKGYNVKTFDNDGQGGVSSQGINKEIEIDKQTQEFKEVDPTLLKDTSVSTLNKKQKMLLNKEKENLPEPPPEDEKERKRKEEWIIKLLDRREPDKKVENEIKEDIEAATRNLKEEDTKNTEEKKDAKDEKIKSKNQNKEKTGKESIQEYKSVYANVKDRHKNSKTNRNLTISTKRIKEKNEIGSSTTTPDDVKKVRQELFDYKAVSLYDFNKSKSIASIHWRKIDRSKEAQNKAEADTKSKNNYPFGIPVINNEDEVDIIVPFERIKSVKPKEDFLQALVDIKPSTIRNPQDKDMSKLIEKVYGTYLTKQTKLLQRLPSLSDTSTDYSLSKMAESQRVQHLVFGDKVNKIELSLNGSNASSFHFGGGHGGTGMFHHMNNIEMLIPQFETTFNIAASAGLLGSHEPNKNIPLNEIIDELKNKEDYEYTVRIIKKSYQGMDSFTGNIGTNKILEKFMKLDEGAKFSQGDWKVYFVTNLPSAQSKINKPESQRITSQNQPKNQNLSFKSEATEKPAVPKFPISKSKTGTLDKSETSKSETPEKQITPKFPISKSTPESLEKSELYIPLDKIKVRKSIPDEQKMGITLTNFSSMPKPVGGFDMSSIIRRAHESHKTNIIPEYELIKYISKLKQNEILPPVKNEDKIIIGKNIANKEEVLSGSTVLRGDVVQKYTFERPQITKSAVTNTTVSPRSQKKEEEKHGRRASKEVSVKGVIHYKLSDRTFIDKGWTQLPTQKMLRTMKVFRMRPTKPEFNWFARNKDKKVMLYDSGEKFAEIDSDSRGRWFYKNGRLALDYYNAEEMNAQQRFVVYSNGEPDEKGTTYPVTVLAMFDFLGNGVVFDHSGKIRLKYNQTEGVILDRDLGPVSNWKWHSLNDPPVLQQVMIDTRLATKDPNIAKLGQLKREKKQEPEEILVIEYDNFIKEKSKKLAQSFKPYQIKMKALKINKNFSLKVLDQKSIYLIFRDGIMNHKLNMGMDIDPDEIIDTDVAEVGDVLNSVERYPARSNSLEHIQRTVKYVQQEDRSRHERYLRQHPIMPISSNELPQAISRPSKPVFSSVSSKTYDCLCRCGRKPSCPNIYYDTRVYP